MFKRIKYVILFFEIFSCSTYAQELYTQSAEPPVIPVGEDAYLHWDKLPYQRIGVRAYMKSTFDRRGNNFGSDGGHFLYQESDSFNVALDFRGNGILYFMRANHFHGSPWHYEIDGNDFIVKETATDDPVGADEKFEKTEFIPQDLFPFPLTWTWSTTKGADLMWRPLSFENSLRIAYSRTFYGTGYFIYHTFAPGTKHLSQSVTTWDQKPPKQSVLDLINNSGNDIVGNKSNFKNISGTLELKPYQWTTLAKIQNAPATIRKLVFSVPRDHGYDFGKCRLRITWDNRWYPSVDAPVDLFFGTGQLYNNNNREYLVKGFPFVIRYSQDSIYLSCYYPMPFFNNAVIEIQERNGKNLNGINYKITTEPYTDPINHVGYFHATYSDHPKPELGKDITFLDTRNIEGAQQWSGNFVGMSFIFTKNGIMGSLEGDPRFFFDNSRTPQAQGTGTEEWGGGGDYWGGKNMTIPFAGHPVGKSRWKGYDSDLDIINSAYRFLIADHFPFGNRAVINLEHGGNNEFIEAYEGVVYWYGMDAPSLVLTDELCVYNDSSIKAHQYSSPGSEEPYSLVSRYELGAEKDGSGWWENEIYNGSKKYSHAEEDFVRTTTGTIKFTVDLIPENLGVMLRRKFDYAYPNQCANVYVRESNKGKDWNYAGQWYTSGSNTCVFSRPGKGNFSEAELLPTEHNIITSNRRWREEEFLIARSLTENIDRLDVKIEFVPVELELFPGQPYPEKNAWSESRYWVYCYKMPTVNVKNIKSIVK